MTAARRSPELLPPEDPSRPVRSAASRPALGEHALTSRVRSGSGFFTNENLDRFTHLLDDQFRLPGTRFRFGIDGIIGLIPGLGDIAGGLLSCVTLAAAWVRGVPYITLIRMLVNIAIEVIIGTVPLFGDIFDIAWKANRRNYALLIRHIEQPRRHTWRDWAFLLTFAVAAIAIFLVPLFLLVWVLEMLAHQRI